MRPREYGVLFLVILIGTAIPLAGFFTLLQRPCASTNSKSPELHSRVIRWLPENIAVNTSLGGFVGEWRPDQNVSVQRIQVWMGNPNGITWEGDVNVVKNRSAFNAPDSLLVHYQFDKHAESPIPHQLMFDLSPVFPVKVGETIYVYRLFVNCGPTWTRSGDGEVIIYYTFT